MALRRFGHLGRFARRLAWGVAGLGLTFDGSAQTLRDLVIHNGFEACWVSSVDRLTLGALIVAAVDGAPGCVPAVTSGSLPYCYTTTCAGGLPGCPTVLRGGQAIYAPGTQRFDATSGLDAVSGKITVFGVECDFAIDTRHVTLSYGAQYADFAPDGNDGSLPSALAIVNASASGLQSGDYSLSGQPLCSVQNPGLSTFAAILTSVQPSLESALQPTLDYAWCPVPF